MTFRSRPASGPTSPSPKVSRGDDPDASRTGSNLRAWSSDGRRHRGISASLADGSSGSGAGRASVATPAPADAIPDGGTPLPALALTSRFGAIATPAAAARARTSSESSSSRRRRPKSPKAIAVATAPVVVTRVGARPSDGKIGPLRPTIESTAASGPHALPPPLLPSRDGPVGTSAGPPRGPPLPPVVPGPGPPSPPWPIAPTIEATSSGGIVSSADARVVGDGVGGASSAGVADGVGLTTGRVVATGRSVARGAGSEVGL